MLSPYIRPLLRFYGQKRLQVLIKYKLPSSICSSITNHPRFSGRKAKQNFFLSRNFKTRSIKGKELHPWRGYYCLPEQPVEIKEKEPDLWRMTTWIRLSLIKVIQTTVVRNGRSVSVQQNKNTVGLKARPLQRSCMKRVKFVTTACTCCGGYKNSKNYDNTRKWECTKKEPQSDSEN